MFEKIYACLLRFYPRHFREKYGDAALQLFRDRSRNETGPFLQLRLWIDLLYDLAISVGRKHQRIPDSLACALAEHQQHGTPAFYVFGYEAPCLGSLLVAGVLSLATFGLIAFSTEPRRNLIYGYALTVWMQDPVNSRKLDAAERRRVMNAVIENVKRYYFDPKVAQQIADALLMYEKRGDYNAVAEGGAFADLLTRHIRDVSHDMHLEVVYNEEVLPDAPLKPTPALLARYRKELEQSNCTFEPVKVLPHNIGYLKLDAFPDVSICKARAEAAMASLNGVDAIIFDLRDNGGGSGEMVTLLASYLFDHPEFLYDPRTNPTVRSWTQPRQGNRLVDKPAYVLTSVSTISAAEQFTYDLKMLKRVTVVGETTHGSAHAGVFRRINDHFGMGIPRLKAINPFSETDWEGTGIVPDIKVKAADALETAERLAKSKLQRR